MIGREGRDRGGDTMGGEWVVEGEVGGGDYGEASSIGRDGHHLGGER